MSTTHLNLCLVSESCWCRNPLETFLNKWRSGLQDEPYPYLSTGYSWKESSPAGNLAPPPPVQVSIRSTFRRRLSSSKLHSREALDDNLLIKELTDKVAELILAGLSTGLEAVVRLRKMLGLNISTPKVILKSDKLDHFDKPETLKKNKKLPEMSGLVLFV